MNNDTVTYHKKMTFKPPYDIKLYGNEVDSDGLLIFGLPEECKDFTKVTIDDKEYPFYSYYNNEFAINVSDLSEGIYDISITCFGNSEIALKQINDTIIVNNPSSIDDNPPVISPVGDLDDLNNAINGCNESDIYLDRDYYLSTPDFFRGLEIRRPLTIHGNGHKISIFGCSGNIFNIMANNVSFENIIFIGGLGDYNGGAFNGKSTAINCTFNNFMALNGGAMYGGTAINCTFNNNQAISGSKGGAIYNGTAINCIFNNNEAYNGGAMYGGTAINCTFNNNHAYNGGAIYNGTAIDCTFNNNQADIEGSAMYCGVAKYCIFNNNTYYNTTIFKYETVILAPSITAAYNSGKYFVATLKDENGNPIKNTDVQIKFNGKTQTQKSDKNGQVKLTTNGLAPKTYTASIAFKGNDNYTSSSASSKIVVKKATPKITAKAKTFKKSVKTKKYTMTLKANSKALKNKYVYLKVNGKTFMAKTNAKGQATFKITKLTKKGTHKTTITFKGDKYYNKKVANTKITIK